MKLNLKLQIGGGLQSKTDKIIQMIQRVWILKIRETDVFWFKVKGAQRLLVPPQISSAMPFDEWTGKEAPIQPTCATGLLWDFYTFGFLNWQNHEKRIHYILF